MAPKRKRSLSTYAKGAVYAARGAYKIARRSANRTRRYANRTATAPMTSQHDSRLVYRKKTMPKYKKKKWVSFKKKVTAVEYSNRNLQNATTTAIHFLYAAPNRSGYVATMIYGINGTPGTVGNPSIPPLVGLSGTGQMDDMYDVLALKYAPGGTAATGRKFLFGSAVMDVHATNIGDATAILEVYEIIARKTHTPGNTTYDGVEDLFVQGFVDYSPMVNSVAVPSSVRIGTTPFNCKLFCQYFTVKSKRRIHITPGEVTSFQIRDPTNRFIAGNMLGKPNVGWRKGECKGYFFQAYGAARFSGSDLASDLSPPVNIKFQVIKSYSFKQLDSDPIQYGHVEQ